MTENEKIREMARDIDGSDDCIEPCNGCNYYSYPNCRDVKIADRLYSKGYRKASEVAKEVIADIRQSLINMILLNITGEEYDLAKAIADVEKKYTEVEK